MFGNREKLNIRLPGDPGPNPYSSSTPVKELPVRGLKLPQIVNRPVAWYAGVIATGLLWAWQRQGFHWPW